MKPYALLLLVLTVGCPFAKKKAEQPTGKPVQITAKAATGEYFLIEMEVLDQTVRMHVHNAPEGALLVCELDGEVQAFCGDEVEWEKPGVGDHIVRITARNDDGILAVDETIFTIAGVAEVVPIQPAVDNPLALVIDDPNFSNGAALDVNKELKLRVKFAKDPGCAAALRCNYDSLTNTFWHQCEKENTLPPGYMAFGLQYFSIQAKCGDQIGPKLDMYWYGVPGDYEPLALESTVTSDQSRYVFSLIKANDCPDELLKFMCAASQYAAFRECSNIQMNISTGFRIKALCKQDSGPVFTVH